MRDNEGVIVTSRPMCILCQQEGTWLYQGLRDCLFKAPGDWGSQRCTKCGLVWLDPHPIPSDVGKLYESYYTHQTGEAIPKYTHLPKMIGEAIDAGALSQEGDSPSDFRLDSKNSPTWKEIANVRHPLDLRIFRDNPRQTLLEFGCGNGRFLAEMKKLGWNVTGVELDPKSVKIAKDHFGLHIFQGTLRDAGFTTKRFDLITSNHVFEHLLDPIETLQVCKSLLSPSGRLVMIMPNVQSLGHQLFKDKWRGVEIPRHMFLYSPSSLKRCAEMAGLRVLATYTVARSARSMYARSFLLWKKGVLPGGLAPQKGIMMKIGSLAFSLVEYNLCRLLNVGEELVFVAAKQ